MVARGVARFPYIIPQETFTSPLKAMTRMAETSWYSPEKLHTLHFHFFGAFFASK